MVFRPYTKDPLQRLGALSPQVRLIFFDLASVRFQHLRYILASLIPVLTESAFPPYAAGALRLTQKVKHAVNEPVSCSPKTHLELFVGSHGCRVELNGKCRHEAYNYFL